MFNQDFIYVIDGTALIFRNYHANLSYLINSKGMDTTAISGVITSLNQYMREMNPSKVAVVFDPKGGSFRHQIFSEYKENRNRPDEQLIAQIPVITEMVKALGFPVYIVKGYEADDVIGTIAKHHAKQKTQVIIESRDKDFIQLIDEYISLSDLGNDKEYDLYNGSSKFGVPIKYTIDFLAICGDSVDNIPGVKAVGEKTAADLINTYGGLEEIYAAIDSGKFVHKIGRFNPETLQKKMLESRDNAFLSYRLATIETNAPVENMELADLQMQDVDVNKFLDLCEEHELFRLRSMFTEGSLDFISREAYKKAAPEIAAYYATREKGQRRSSLHLSKRDFKNLMISEAQAILANNGQATPEILERMGTNAPVERKAVAKSKTAPEVKLTKEEKTFKASTEAFTGSKKGDYSLEKLSLHLEQADLLDLEATKTFLNQSTTCQYRDPVAYSRKHITPIADNFTPSDFTQVVDTFKSLLAQQLEPTLAQAKQVSLLLETNEALQVPEVLHLLVESGETVNSADAVHGEPLYQQRKLFSLNFQNPALRSFFIQDSGKTDADVTMTYPAFCQAFAQQVFIPLLQRTEVRFLVSDLKRLAHEFNLPLAITSQVGAQVHDIKILAFTRNSNLKDRSLTGIAKHFCNLTFPEVKYLKTKVDRKAVAENTFLSTLFMPLFADLAQSTIESDLYNKIEQPLWKFLYRMEVAGVKVDLESLQQVQAELSQELDKSEQQIYSHAGRIFNINSPKQVASVLFDQLGLENKDRGSTKAEVLHEIRDQHPIVEELLNYRSLATLLASHVEPLLKYTLSTPNHLIHTTFLQNQVVTGRLSSQNPNLQNVPTRSDLAKKIRSAFIAPQGYKMVSFDYSQIELRVSASLSGDDTMVEAFNHGEDIHAKTAAKLFAVDITDVEYQQRQIAKAINFGLNYGKTAFSLATELGVSRSQAQNYINEYFTTYPKIKEFISSMVEKATNLGYIQTINQRTIPLYNINHSINSVAQSEKRNATNYPIQGSAAEIIKAAMVKLEQELASQMPEVLCHLQVHDELVFSIPEHLIDTYVPKIQEIMEHGAELPRVKLKVDYTVADYWSK